ncbi:hypothetical protein X805_01660 [Sphaerotilus natans subsp. natans DSM 6575]|uniref:DUF4397 domain-containing protein n=1 Tax=Sphaerotilus natans subsp. natans DSM 6575 TaxID=1286631 RepID=A0A059KSI3_9BURK|nr:DUF4397 domain-containing protein [Sphaerotilus natans]KDB54184.1 hypothetical protein X805_01660 [Sphaerotilus natans subsp. natans DSM 6575]SIQ20712.1 protein of unknown function [Sphaerotilus natans]
MNPLRWLPALLLSATVALIGGCGGASDDDNATVRVINASTNYGALDLYVDDTLRSSAIAYGQTSGYIGFEAGSHTTTLTRTGSTTALSSVSRSLSEDYGTTVIAYQADGSLKTAQLSDSESAPSSGRAKLLVFNASPDAGSVDVYLSGSSDTLDNATLVASSVSAGSSSGSYTTVGSGTYRLRIAAAGSTTDLRLDAASMTLGSQGVYTLVVTPTSGGVLVNSLLVSQGGAITAIDTDLARVRLVSAVASSGAVGASFNGSTLATSVTSPAIGSYALVKAGSATPTISVNGASLSTTAITLAAGSDTTLMVWGPAASASLSVISDDNRLPTSSTSAKIRLIHGASTNSNPLTLTTNYSAVAENIALGAASTSTSVTAGSSTTIEVSDTTLASALYSLSDVTLSAKGVYTVFMLPSGSSVTGSLRKER